MLGMRYLTKFVASVAVLCIGVIPLFASAPCPHAALLDGCCKPDCPTMAMPHAVKAGGSDRAQAGAPNRCKVSTPLPMSFVIQETIGKLASPEAQPSAVVDPQPRLTLSRHSRAPSRIEHTLQRPRSSLCIFLI